PYGWESIFLIFGLVGCIWSVAWHFLGSSSPIDYPGISEEELSWILKREYDVNGNNLRFSQFGSSMSRGDIDPEIESSIIIATEDENTRLLKASQNQKYVKVGNASNETLETSNSNHFGVDIDKLGYFAGIIGFFGGIIGDYLVSELNIPVITVRRGAQIIGSFGNAIFFLFAVYLSKTAIEGILLMTIGSSIGSFLFFGVHMSQLDIAPKYAGVIWGLGNMFGVMAGLFGVALTGLILDIT
ncbi:17605_t:CDS:2, partial [Racocetra persica]